MSRITPEQTEKLLTLAAGKLGTTPDALRATLQQNGLQGALSPQDAARAAAVLQDREKLTTLLADPSVRRLLEQILD